MSDLLSFAQRVVAWQSVHGRSGLPWQYQSAYEVWVSEIMLQQTQVASVIPFYLRFMQRFPQVEALADAPLDDVLALWSGLGYYARARNLHASAQLIQQKGYFPNRLDELVALPGIGLSTAAAIVSLAFKRPAAIFDGNVKRVLARHIGMLGDISSVALSKQLYAVAQARVPDLNELKVPNAAAIYTQGMMDLGALICTKQQPKCELCPVMQDCVAYQQQQTDVIPAPKSRAAVKSLTVYMPIFWHKTDADTNAGSGSVYVLLERRPSKGIWAQLWSLPVLENDPALLAMSSLIHEQAKWKSLPEMTHVLTHRRLLLRPSLLALADMDQLAELALLLTVDANCLSWVALPQALELGLPKPTRMVLEQLSKSAFKS